MADEEPYQRWIHAYDEILSTHVIGAKEGLLLEEIVQVVRLIDDFQAALEEGEAVVDGKPSAVAIELRQQRALLSKLIAQLPPQESDDDRPAPLTPRQERARKAAEARWSRPGARRKDRR